VGAKTAADLLGKYGSVDGLYAALSDVRSERLRAALGAAEADVRRNQTLIRLRTDAGRGVPLDELEPRPADRGRLRELYEGWGFRSLAAAVAEPAQVQLL
jgi:DNA polymerase I